MTATLMPPPSSTEGKRGRIRALLGITAAGFLIVLAPVVLLAGAANPPCSVTNPTDLTTPAGTPGGGMFAKPLSLKPGRWYRVGATEYGGPSDPTSGSYGASGAYLPAYPDSFAELSLLDSNPTSHGDELTFADANALNNLPYGIALRVANGTNQRVLIKRDIGYGQGPGQTIPYRIDVWWQAAEPLGITKTPVEIELAPASGAAATLSQLPATTDGTPAAGCVTAAAPLQLTSGQTATILPDGQAAAPTTAPAAVKQAIAAGNQLTSKPYLYGGGHGQPLTELAAGYDCSSTVSYVLHAAGLFSDYAETSGQLESYGQDGAGQWITVYANSAHAFVSIAGIVLDTAHYAPTTPTGSGPRWQPASIIPAQYAGDEADGNGGFVQRHPKGL